MPVKEEIFFVNLCYPTSYYIAMHNTVSKSRLPVLAYIQAIIRPIHYP